MAHEEHCRDDLPLHYAPDRCKSYDFPCYNTETGKCVNRDSTENDPDCKHGKIADKLKCNNKWPDFPCYDLTDGQCYNKDGDLLLDPIADTAYAVNEVYHGTCDLLFKLLVNADAPGASRETKMKTYELINGYWSAFGKELSCPDIIMKGEYVRTYPLNSYMKTAKEKAISLSKVISSKLKKQNSKNNGSGSGNGSGGGGRTRSKGRNKNRGKTSKNKHTTRRKRK